MNDPEAAARYVRENFEPNDRLAVVILNRQTGSVVQRIAAAERIAAADFQAWLTYQNSRRQEVYISMNALREGARGRTKDDAAMIRHLYLDFDENGTDAVRGVMERPDLPWPNYRIATSPDKWQVVWKVEGFAKDEAERLQRSLVRQHHADPAATDCARVLRLPGYYNHKYVEPYLVQCEALSPHVYRPANFPRAEEREIPFGSARPAGAARGHLSQSEYDWAYAKRALARGESPEMVAAAIASYRRFDKHNPQDYAERTVRKASLELQLPGTPRSPSR